MLLTSRSIVKAHSVKFYVGVINLPQPQFPCLRSESKQGDNETLGQVKWSVRHQDPTFSPYPQARFTFDLE